MVPNNAKNKIHEETIKVPSIINDLYRSGNCLRIKTIPFVQESKLKRRQAVPIFKPFELDLPSAPV